MVAYCILCGFFQELPFYKTILFILFEIVCIWAVGRTILELLKFDLDDNVERTGIAYAVGYTVNILIYFIIFPFGGRTALLITMWTLGTLAALYLGIKTFRKEIRVQPHKPYYVIMVFITIILAFQLFIFASNNMAPTHTGVNTYYTDLFYWSADAVSFTKTFPPVNFREMDLGYYHYHYFSSIQIAVLSICTNIDVFNIVCEFSFLQSAILLVFGTYIFLHSIITDKLFLYIGMFLVLFSSGNETFTYVTPVSHLYTAPFGCDIGIALGMFTMSVMIKQVKARIFNWKYFLLTLFLFSACLGAKSPVGVLVLTMLGIICLGWLFSRTRQGIQNAFSYGIPLLIAFSMIYIFVINGLPKGSSAIEIYSNAQYSYSVINTQQKNDLILFLTDNYSWALGQVLFLIIYALLVNPAVFILFLAGCIKKIVDIKTFDIFDFAFFITVCLGIAFTRYLKLIGFSQVYFIMVAFPYAVAFGLKSFQKTMNDKKDKLHLRELKIFCCCLIVLGICQFVSSEYFKPQLQSGWYKLQSAVFNSPKEDIYLIRNRKTGGIGCEEIIEGGNYDYYYGIVSEDVYRACKWLHSNSPGESIIASNMDISGNHYRIGVLAERFIWFKDDKIIANAAKGARDAIDYLTQNNVQYLIVYKNDYDPSANIIYENDSVIIIELGEARL